MIETAHEVGLSTTATIMFGHVDGPRNWARHLIAIRDLQQRTGGITEFVPLPFVHMEAPIYLKGGMSSSPRYITQIPEGTSESELLMVQLLDHIGVVLLLCLSGFSPHMVLYHCEGPAKITSCGECSH